MLDCISSLLDIASIEFLRNREMASPMKTSKKDDSVLKTSPTNSSGYGSNSEIGKFVKMIQYYIFVSLIV